MAIAGKLRILHIIQMTLSEDFRTGLERQLTLDTAAIFRIEALSTHVWVSADGRAADVTCITPFARPDRVPGCLERRVVEIMVDLSASFRCVL